MKCIAAVVMMALAVAVAEGSLYNWASPLAYSLPHATVVQDNSYARYIAAAPWGYSASPLAYGSYPYAAYQTAYPTAYVHHQPAVALVQKEARYLAATRGAVHEAPLPGHAVSQQSLNLSPAPGTL